MPRGLRRGCGGDFPRRREAQAEVLPTRCGIPWLGFVVYPTHRTLKRRNAVHFSLQLNTKLDTFERGATTFAEVTASVQGWINHVRYAETSGAARTCVGYSPDPLSSASVEVAHAPR